MSCRQWRDRSARSTGGSCCEFPATSSDYCSETRTTAELAMRATAIPYGRGGRMDAFFEGGGEVGALMRQLDWGATALGPPAAWPHSLRSIVRIVLTSRYPMWLGWGADLTLLYNDGYARILGAKHPD